MRASVIANRDYKIATIDDRLYGAFLEHLGRDPSWIRIPVIVLSGKLLSPAEVEVLGGLRHEAEVVLFRPPRRHRGNTIRRAELGPGEDVRENGVVARQIAEHGHPLAVESHHRHRFRVPRRVRLHLSGRRRGTAA